MKQHTVISTFDTSTKTLRKFEANYTFNMREDETGYLVNIYNICNVIDFLEIGDLDFFEQGAIIQKWAKENQLSLYSAPRDVFNLYNACEKTRIEGTSGVIVEDLS